MIRGTPASIALTPGERRTLGALPGTVQAIAPIVGSQPRVVRGWLRQLLAQRLVVRDAAGVWRKALP